ncbi:MAG: HPr family phosphocarrier protein [Rhabdochlamydiaceae bacterium]|nr:HPr family phosphocarrier protein [Rhabdochlamydiaceae bacterium]
MKISRKVKVKNPAGLHTRPASRIVQMLQGSTSSVYFTCREEKVNAKSIMSLLTLAATKNSLITIEVEGEDAEQIVGKLVEAFEHQFWEI